MTVSLEVGSRLMSGTRRPRSLSVPHNADGDAAPATQSAEPWPEGPRRARPGLLGSGTAPSAVLHRRLLCRAEA